MADDVVAISLESTISVCSHYSLMQPSGIVLLDMNISQAMGPYMDLGLSPQWVSMLRHIVRLPLAPAADVELSSSYGGKTGGIRLFGALNKNAGREGSTVITEETDIVYQVLGNEVINYCTAHSQQLISIFDSTPSKHILCVEIPAAMAHHP